MGSYGIIIDEGREWSSSNFNGLWGKQHRYSFYVLTFLPNQVKPPLCQYHKLQHDASLGIQD